MSFADVLAEVQFHKNDTYQYHRSRDYGMETTLYNVYKGHAQVGELAIEHADMGEDDEGPSRNWKVDFMAVHPGHRHIAGTMLGVAQVDAIAEGQSLTPSENLSGHSSRLVGNLQKRGLVTGSVDATPSNDIDFRHMRAVHPSDRHGERLNTGHVQGGRNLIRRAIKHGKFDR